MRRMAGMRRGMMIEEIVIGIDIEMTGGETEVETGTRSTIGDDEKDLKSSY